ncbi:MAG TPA: hypothetical protein DEP42_04930 [Ruminococcaceae bacterium]|nr:hypothetical protein [Oscillospiraceae bacterium]
MARMLIKASEAYTLMLSRLQTNQEKIAKQAVYAGAKVVADKIKQNLVALPEENFKHLKNGEQFSGLPKRHKLDLVHSFGIAKISLDNQGNWNTKIGFDGYGSMPTKKYPNGLPNQLLARSIESGSSVRKKTPFVRPGLNSSKGEAEKQMEQVINEALQKQE